MLVAEKPRDGTADVKAHRLSPTGRKKHQMAEPNLADHQETARKEHHHHEMLLLTPEHHDHDHDHDDHDDKQQQQETTHPRLRT